MVREFKAIADYEQVINKRLDKLCSRFEKFPETVVKIETEPLKGGMLKYRVEILTPEVKFEGYSHVATLKIETIESDGKCEDVKVVFPSNRFQGEDFSQYYEQNFRCDHCHTNRYRKIVHLFRDEAGKDLMIASTCARSYFGENVFRFLGLYELLSPSMICSDIDDIFIGFGGGIGKFNTVDYCKYAYGTMKKTNTYISQRKKDELEMLGSFVNSTRDKVEVLFSKDRNLPRELVEEIRKERIECGELAKDFDLGEVKDYWFNKYEADKTDNFTRSCFLNLSMIEPKNGLLVYAVSAYMREVEGHFNTDIGGENSQHVGTIKERLRNIKATIRFSSVKETAFGLMTIIKFLDINGNILVWFASGNVNVEMNKEVSLTGTVKKHDEYKGKKQTILNRCRIA